MKGEGKARANLIATIGVVTIIAAFFVVYWLSFIVFAALLFAGFIVQALGREALYENGYEVGYRDGFGDGKGWTDTKAQPPVKKP